MDAFSLAVVALCAAGSVAALGALRAVTRGRDEFQSRLRNAALDRARARLVTALVTWGAAAALVATATADVATADAAPAPAFARPLPAPQAAPQPPLHLRLDTDSRFAG